CRGIERYAAYRLDRHGRACAVYVFNRARITENPSDTSLVGKFLQQVPENRGSLSLSYAHPRYADVSVSAVSFGHQVDDDQNVKAKTGEDPGLPAYGVVDLSALRAL